MRSRPRLERGLGGGLKGNATAPTLCDPLDARDRRMIRVLYHSAVEPFWLHAPLSNSHRNERAPAYKAVSSSLYTSMGDPHLGDAVKCVLVCSMHFHSHRTESRTDVLNCMLATQPTLILMPVLKRQSAVAMGNTHLEA